METMKIKKKYKKNQNQAKNMLYKWKKIKYQKK